MQEDVDDMATDDEERPADVPRAVQHGRLVFAERASPMRAYLRDLSQNAAIHDLLHGFNDRRKAEVEARLKNAGGAFLRLYEPIEVLGPRSTRLLDQHGLAGVEGGNAIVHHLLGLRMHEYDIDCAV